MGMWIEMGIFFLVILFAFHQILDLKLEQRKRLDEKKDENRPDVE